MTDYASMIDALRTAGYSFSMFGDSPASGGRRVLIRHDVDFSLAVAAQMAEWEAGYGVAATYFVQVRSPLYNAMSRESRAQMSTIASQGHAVGLHFDASNYLDAQAPDVALELDILRSDIPMVLDSVVSLHRPTGGLEVIREWGAARHVPTVYDAPWTTEFSYFSDSGGRWRRGSPVDSPEFNAGADIQVLAHPLWWLLGGETPGDQLRSFASLAPRDTLRYIRETAVSFVF